LAHLTDANFAAISSLNSLEALKTIVLYGIRLYGDFAGYSAMAIGVSMWFGLPALENFRQPYFSRGIVEFWTRWHISLSSWFRDYFFFPLSRALMSRFGSRRAFWLQTISMLLTMTLTGLWHGASFTFLLWGFLHGLYMTIERLLGRSAFLRRNSTWLTALIGVLITQILVFFGWIFFRAPSISDGFLFLQRFLVPSGTMSPVWWLELFTPLLLMVIFDTIQIGLSKPSHYWRLSLTWPVAVRSLLIVCLITILSFLMLGVFFTVSNGSGRFVYQNF
jgi:D-alanyl-lipoteichoic acid acyltransferase DltB (MBOAT superfamily)